MKLKQLMLLSTIGSVGLLIGMAVKFGILTYVGFCILGVLISMHLFFFIGVVLKNHTFVDTAWGLSFVIVAHVSFWLQEGHSRVRWLVLGMVTIWGIRLFTHIITRTVGQEEDPRYQEMRKSMERKKGALLASYIRIYIIQGFLAVVIAAPIIMINTMPPNNFAAWYPAGIAVWLLGFLFEVIGDRQLKNFLAKPENQGQLMTKKLWRYTRHPNYFGEATLWWGIYLVALTVNGGWASFFGPALLTFLLLKISGVPLAEKLMQNLPGFDDYRRKTNAFIPGLPKAS